VGRVPTIVTVTTVIKHAPHWDRNVADPARLRVRSVV